MSDPKGPGPGVGPREQDRQGTPPGGNLFHSPPGPGQGLLPAPPPALESADLAAQRCDVALGLLDAPVEPADVALLVGQALLDPIQLGQDRGLLVARLGGLAALLLELLLGLAQLALLGLERIVLLRRLGQRVRDGQRHGERRDGERAPAHASGRPRARKPPMPPSSVPASISEMMLCGRRNVSRATPSVSLTSGSMRGPMSA